MQAEPIPPTEPTPPAGRPAPRKASRTVLLLSALVLLVVVGGILAVALLPRKPATPGAAATSTPTIAATSTPTLPAGFQSFSNNYFSMIYPQNWTLSAPDISPDGEQFAGSLQTFTVYIDTTGNANPTRDTQAFCLGSTNVSAPTMVTIGGDQWVRTSCDHFGGHFVDEEVVHHGVGFNIIYNSLINNYPADAAQYYQPMERSFTFLNQ